MLQSIDNAKSYVLNKIMKATCVYSIKEETTKFNARYKKIQVHPNKLVKYITGNYDEVTMRQILNPSELFKIFY